MRSWSLSAKGRIVAPLIDYVGPPPPRGRTSGEVASVLVDEAARGKLKLHELDQELHDE